MKTFKQLSAEQKVNAIEHALDELLECIETGLIEFGGELQLKINIALKETKDPCVVHSKIMEVAGPKLREIATASAENAVYAEQGEYIVEGVA